MSSIPKRKLKNSQEISVIGFGGLMLSGINQKQADEIVEEALCEGVNFFDVAPTYGDAEIKLGCSLAGRRDRVLLSCKTTRRDKHGSLLELNESRKRLKVDHFDFYIMHGIRDPKADVEFACSKEGMLMTAIEAKKQGLVARIGFSAHTEESAISAFNVYDFDFIMFPVNIFCFFSSNFGNRVINLARGKNADIIGIKALAFRKWKNNLMKKRYSNCWYEPIEDKETAKTSLSWALAQDIVSAIPPADIKMFRIALTLVKDKSIQKPEDKDIEKIKELLKEVEPIFP